MTLFTISTLPLLAASDWSSLSPRRPALSRVFVFPVLPLALVPPVMVYLAGTHRPEMFPQELAGDSWVGLAVLFFLAEVATVLSMAWLIKHVSQSNRLAVDDYAAYLIAALAPVPLWLSSLGLLVPNLLFTATIATGALAFMCRAVYHGIVGLARVREPVTAAWITQIAIGGSLIPWVLLLAVLLT
jgi:hypothetical protein